MSEMNRNEHFIMNMLLIIQRLAENDLEKDVKEYIHELEFTGVEKNSLYARCIRDLKNIDSLNGQEYVRSAKEICEHYLKCSTGEKYTVTKYVNDYRKDHYKQLNVDIPKNTMQEFESILKKKKITKKAIVLKWIDEFIEENK